MQNLANSMRLGGEEENWLSVAAIEAELKPKVMEFFDTVASTYKRWRRSSR